MFAGMHCFLRWKEVSKWKNIACLEESPREEKPSSTAAIKALLKLSVDTSNQLIGEANWEWDVMEAVINEL